MGADRWGIFRKDLGLTSELVRTQKNVEGLKRKHSKKGTCLAV